MSYHSIRSIVLAATGTLVLSAGCADDAAPALRAPLVGASKDKPVSSSDPQVGCTFNGRSYALGDNFYDALECNQCSCAADGIVGCDARACDPKDACTLGDSQFASGNSVPCEDGCNSCLCNEGSWSGTDAACGALPKVALCDDEPKGVARVEAIYRKGDALALRVGMGGCGGSTPAFKLCWDGAIAESFPVQMRLRVIQEQITACSAWVTQEKVFDLTPLREAYTRAYRTDTGTIAVHLDGDSVRYEF
jgi:hypothetical protein